MPSKPHKCPVCDGAGKVSRPPDVPGDRQLRWTDGTLYDCRACNGTGIVWEHFEYRVSPSPYPGTSAGD